MFLIAPHSPLFFFISAKQKLRSSLFFIAPHNPALFRAFASQKFRLSLFFMAPHGLALELLGVTRANTMLSIVINITVCKVRITFHLLNNAYNLA